MFVHPKTRMISADDALPGRAAPMPLDPVHFVTGAPMTLSAADGEDVAIFAMGCFWGVERLFWSIPGVSLTLVGYAGGFTANPTYDEVCSGKTGHTEVVRIHYDPARVSYADLLRVFWENHDPTQGMRQGNDRGTQYRSAIYATSQDQLETARASAAVMAPLLRDQGPITTEIAPAGPFYAAEGYHQQYLAKNPDGYCGIKGTGVTCPIGLQV